MVYRGESLLMSCRQDCRQKRVGVVDIGHRATSLGKWKQKTGENSIRQKKNQKERSIKQLRPNAKINRNPF